MVAHAVAVEPVSDTQGIFAICREFRSKKRWEDLQDQPVTGKIPYATDQGIFAADQGFLIGRAANLQRPENFPRACAFRRIAA